MFVGGISHGLSPFYACLNRIQLYLRASPCRLRCVCNVSRIRNYIHFASHQDFIQASRPESWARFLHHARRVRVLSCIWAWHSVAYLKTLHAFRPDKTVPLLPGLRVLAYVAYDPLGLPDMLLPVKLLAHSGLRALRVSCNLGRDYEITPSLDFLSQLAPGLRKLHMSFPASLFERPSRSRVAVPNLDHLTAFHCQSNLLSPPLFLRLGQLPGLKALNVHIDRQVTSTLVDDTTLFPSLQSLLLTTAGHNIDIVSVLRLISSANLKTFYLSLEHQPSAADLRQYIRLLTQKPLLARLDIRVNRGFSLDPWVEDDQLDETEKSIITGDDLRPLLALPRMTTFVLRDIPLSLTDGHLQEIALAWPLLKDLVLGPSLRTRRLGVTLEGLKPLSLHCPKLRSLALSMYATSPTGPPPPSRRFESLRRFKGIAKLRPAMLSKRHSRADLSATLASHDATGWCGSESVCTRLEYLDIGNSTIDDPQYVATFVAQHFPNVRTVTDLGYVTENFRTMAKINKLLRKQGKERWAAFDRMAPDPDAQSHLGACVCGRCKINPLFAILYASSMDFVTAD